MHLKIAANVLEMGRYGVAQAAQDISAEDEAWERASMDERAELTQPLTLAERTRLMVARDRAEAIMEALAS